MEPARERGAAAAATPDERRAGGPLAPPPPQSALSIAPMMEWTDRNYRYMMRLLTRHTELWTEMVVADTLLFSPTPLSHIRFSPEERPVVCQIGGSDPDKLARAARMVEAMGYDAVNLNCGCPSNRVAGKGAFGARLMHTPELVRDCVAAMRAAVTIPVTVKCRLGADDVDSYADFARFLAVVFEGGCADFVVHARKCFLRGLNPKENRTVPPLRYDWVQRAALQFPHLRISLNGGVGGLAHARQLLALRRGSGAWGTGAAPAGGADCASCGDADGVATAGSTMSASHPAPECASAAGGVDCSTSDGGSVCGGGGAATAAEPYCCTAADDTAQVPPPDDDDGDAACGAARSHHSLPPPHATVWDWVPVPPTFPVEPGCSVDVGALARGAPVPPPPPPPPLTGCTGVDGGGGGGHRVLHSVMLGRAAYSNPWLFADADRAVFGARNPGRSRREVVLAYLDYADAVAAGVPPEERGVLTYRPGELMKPLLGLFHGVRGGPRFRTLMAQTVGAGRAPLREGVLAALAVVDPTALDERPPD